MSNEELYDYIVTNKVPCPKCGNSNFTEIKQFNLMFETYRGTVEGEKSIIYLRPENAQGEYTNYLNVLRSMRTKLPFSIGQIGKAFRNEITPGNFTFRTIEFEQMEYQTFCKPGDDLALYEYFKEYGRQFFMDLGLPAEKLRYHDHEKLAFYAAAACDIEYNFPVFGWGEINGTHDRTNHDLSAHQQYAGENMEYLDPVTNEKYVPYIVESTYGVDRTVLAILMEAYDEEALEDGTTREVLKLNPALAPYKVAVLPLMKKTQGEKATELYQELSKHFMVTYDESGSIGKRYRRQDEVGTPFCVTVDFDTENDNCVTVRNRDTMTQERVNINDLVSYVEKYIKF
jgi:glycyl-tRNA synthetase